MRVGEGDEGQNMNNALPPRRERAPRIDRRIARRPHFHGTVSEKHEVPCLQLAVIVVFIRREVIHVARLFGQIRIQFIRKFHEATEQLARAMSQLRPCGQAGKKVGEVLIRCCVCIWYVNVHCTFLPVHVRRHCKISLAGVSMEGSILNNLNTYLY